MPAGRDWVANLPGTRKRNCRPSGKNAGKRGLPSLRETRADTPPSAGTRCRPPALMPKTMVPSRFQAPPAPPNASHKLCAGPPATAIFFSLSSVKKPMKRLSGDQKGKCALSVPGRRCDSSASSARSHRVVLPSEAGVDEEAELARDAVAGSHVPLAVRQQHDLAQHSAFAQHLVRAARPFERQPAL